MTQMILVFMAGLAVGLLLTLAFIAAVKKACCEERRRTMAEIEARRMECAKAYRRGKAYMFLGD